MKNTAKATMTALLSAAVISAASVTAVAEEPVGSVVFYAEKSVLGQGLVTEPVRVPYYEGDTGIDVVKRAADVLVTDSEYGSYIGGFADTDTGAELPAEITAAVPEMWGRNTEGYLCEYDYTAESGWYLYVNDQSSMVGISSYEPADNDVVCFRFTVYGYGCDLGIDNTSWGGCAALIDAADEAETELAVAIADSADLKGTQAYQTALDLLGAYGASFSDKAAAAEALTAAPEDTEQPSAEDTQQPAESAPDKTSPDTGVEGAAAAVGIMLISAAALTVSRKRR